MYLFHDLTENCHFLLSIESHQSFSIHVDSIVHNNIVKITNYANCLVHFCVLFPE